MAEPGFEDELAGVFDRCEAALAERLTRETEKAHNLQAEDSRRLAFTFVDAIEHEVRPAVDRALAGYDRAINRPIVQNPRWEAALRRHIEQVVEAGVRQALALDSADHAWKPLLSDEAPKLRARLAAAADAHFATLGKARRKRRGQDGLALEIALWIVLFAAGVVVGVLASHLLRP